MMLRRLRLVAAAAMVALTAPVTAMAQPRPAAPAFNAGDVIPFDAAVRTGTLPNGLRYYIRQNERPAKRLALRLAVKAGSLDEADDQQGLAHFLEHMAFNGSAHFKPGELISYFESTGARLGPHVNAYTSFDETVYMLELPTDTPEVVSRGFTALADFAGGLTLDAAQVERERGVVIEEWRGRLGASSRIRDKQLPLLYYQSRYAERLPIGRPEVIRTAPVERLRAFYETWYRPERMAVVAVGDVDPAALEAAIRSAFGPLQARGTATPRVEAPVPLHSELLVNVASDPELTQSSVQIVWKHRSEGERLVRDYRRGLVERLLSQMLNDRFADLARRPDAKFLAAGGGGSSLSPQIDTFSLSARVPDGGLADGLTLVAIEGRRVREHGFQASELDRAKRWMAASYERAYNERDKTESGSYAQEYLRHFLTEEPSPGIEYEFRLVQEVLSSISLDEVTATARQWLAGDGHVVLATSPEKDGLAVPSEAALRDTLAAAARVAVTPWSESTTTRTLLEKKPQPGSVASRRELAGLGITVVRFENGLEAWLKPTDFKNDQVVFSMYSLGGTSLAAPADFVQASLATTYVELSGFPGLKALEIDKLLAGKIASASPFMSLSTHGISGSAAPAELETALQLAYLSFTSPNDDPDALALMRRQLQAMIANRGQSPGQVFGERVAQVNTSGHYTSRPLTAEDLAGLDRNRMLAAYRSRFANAADFTVFMVGAFQTDAVIPQLAQYLGSLPSTGSRTATFTALEIAFPPAVERARVEKGREPRSQTVMSFFADPPPDPIEQEGISAATMVLETTLRDLLREELGQTYGVSVGLSQSLPQRGHGYTQVSFGAAPENIDAMTRRVIEEVERLQREGPSEDLTSRAREAARRGYETSLRQNAYWMRRLQTVHMLGGDPNEIVTRTERIQAVTPASLQAVFRRYFPLDRHTVVTLVPESPPAP
jgi:zinc protease